MSRPLSADHSHPPPPKKPIQRSFSARAATIQDIQKFPSPPSSSSGYSDSSDNDSPPSAPSEHAEYPVEDEALPARVVALAEAVSTPTRRREARRQLYQASLNQAERQRAVQAAEEKHAHAVAIATQTQADYNRKNAAQQRAQAAHEPSATVRALQANARLAKASIQEAQAHVQIEYKALEEARAKMLAAEMELVRLSELSEAVEVEEARQVATMKSTVDARVSCEKKAVQMLRTRHRAELNATHKQEKQKMERETQQLLAGEEGRRMARQRLRDKQDTVKKHEEELEEMRQTQVKRRVASILQLKENTEKAQSELREKQERRARAKKRREEIEEREKIEILAAGGNPYEVFRRRDAEKKMKREREAQEKARLERQNAISLKLVEEEKRERRLVEAERKKRAAVDALAASVKAGPPPKREIQKKKPSQPLDEIDAFDTKLANKLTVASPVAAAHDDDDQREDMAVPEFPGLWEMDEESASPGRIRLAGKLSKYEQNQLERSHQRHREGIIKKQVVMGKEFQGKAFVARPDVIKFMDFEVGKVYTQTMTLTNVSLSFNAFKLLELPVTIRDFVEVNFVPQGKMSAGMTASVHVTFRPRVNEDIDESIPFLAETGPFSVPIICETRKCLLSVAPTSLVELGEVVVGEVSRSRIVVTNVGALPTTVTIGYDEEFEPSSELTFPRQATVPKHGDAVIEITFRPTLVAELQSRLVLQFEDEGIDDVVLDVQGRAQDVSLFVKREVVDFHVCYIGEPYHETLELWNRGHIARRFSIETPRELRGYLDIVPHSAYAQAGQSFPLQLKLRPDDGILEQCGRLANPETSILEVPVTITSPEQALPVVLTVKAQVTTSEMSFEPQEIDFGTVLTNEGVSSAMEVTNHSLLPQRYAFISRNGSVQGGGTVKSGDISIQPGDGFGVVMPGETKSLQVAYSPRFTGEQQFQLVCRTVVGRDFIIPCRAKGVSPPLRFSTGAVVNFAATALGDSSTHSLYLTNTSSQPQTYEAVPPVAEVTISPRVGTVPAKATIRLQLEYTPQYGVVPEPPLSSRQQPSEPHDDPPPKESPRVAQVQRTRSGKKAVPPLQSREGSTGNLKRVSSARGSKKEAVAAEPVADKEKEPIVPRSSRNDSLLKLQRILSKAGSTESWAEHHHWIVPVFIQGSAGLFLHIDIHACAILPSLVVPSSASGSVLDFGRVGVGHSTVKSIVVQSLSSITARPHFQPLDPSGAFLVLNASRPIQPKGTHDVIVRFSPLEEQPFYERLIMETPAHGRICVVLRGTGVRPNLNIFPQSGALHLGHVVVGERSEAKMQLSCTSSDLSIRYSLNRSPQHVPCNASGSTVFALSPVEAAIAPGKTQDVSVSFSPQHVGVFEEDVDVVLLDDQSRRRLALKGRAWPHSMAMWSKQSTDVSSSPLDVAGLAGPVTLAAREGSAESPYRVAVSMTCVSENVFEGEVVVANLRQRANKGAAGEFALQALSTGASRDGWLLVDGGKGSLEPGARKNLRFRWSSGGGPPRTPRMTLTGTLKGGLPTPDDGVAHVVVDLAVVI